MSKHTRSPEAQKLRELKHNERFKRKEELRIQNAMMSTFGFIDHLTKESVFSLTICTHINGKPLSFVEIVQRKIIAKFGYVYSSVLDHESGEVLNGFKRSSPPLWNWK